MGATDKLTELRKIAPAMLTLFSLNAAIPKIILDVYAQIWVPRHVETCIYRFSLRQMGGIVQAFSPEAPAVIAAVEGPFYPFRRNEEIPEPAPIWPFVRVEDVEVGMPSIGRPTTQFAHVPL